MQFAQAELPVLPHELMKVLYDEECQIVIDVGGGESAIVLGQFCQRFTELSYEALLLVNTFRPFITTVEGIIDACRKIEKVSGLKVTGLISNSNIGRETVPKHIQNGLILAEVAAEKLGVPIEYAIIPDWLEGEFVTCHKTFFLHPYTQYPWQS